MPRVRWRGVAAAVNLGRMSLATDKSSSQPAELTVAELTAQIRSAVESRFSQVTVVGEISNCVKAGSGHVYLTLKDEDAQIRAVMWRNAASRLRFDLRDGIEVVAVGSVEVYPPRGQYQLMIKHLQPRGVGALELALRQLQQKLSAEGLFNADRKRPLPRFPRRIALITSPTGAAVRDMLQVISRRWSAADIVIVPVAVQGAAAAPQIAAALQNVHRIPDVDVVIAGRGGGSLEDLWAFNEEVVARAIAACPLPVISAVGHEIDVSIADLVADVRALTPSEAGELVVPHRSDIAAEIARAQDRLLNGLRERLRRARLQLDDIAARRVLTKPLDRVHNAARQVDELSARLFRMVALRVQNQKQQLQGLGETLDSLSPLKVLARGYTVTRKLGETTCLRTPDDVQPGDTLETILTDGRVISQVIADDSAE